MIEFTYNEEKESWLNENRGFSFKAAISAIELGEFVLVPNPNQRKYKGEQAFAVRIDDYYCVVPFAKDENKVILKTIFRDRKIDKRFKNEKSK